jgi:hypothetical protein
MVTNFRIFYLTRGADLLLTDTDLHWNEENEMYCDVGIDSDGELFPSCDV